MGAAQLTHHLEQLPDAGGAHRMAFGQQPAARIDRHVCANCGEGYHDRFKLPAVEGTCDKCGHHEFKRRPDDNEETVRTRMAEYRAKTAPILPIYEARGIVTRVDGMASMDAVNDAIEAILKPAG